MVIAGSVSIDFGAGWLGTIGSDMLGMYRERSSMGSVEIALTRTDQTPVDGTGTIAHLSFVMEENLAGKTSGTLEICGGTARAINNLGQTIDVFGGCDSVEVYEVVNGIEPPAKPANIIIYPNPANDYLMVDFAENIVSKVEIINAVGQVVLAKDYDSMPGLASFDVSNLPAGTYILKVNSEGSVNAQNVIIQR